MIFEFGDFELDEPFFELRRLGTRVGVQPKALKLIFYLVKNRERVVCTRELFTLLWQAQSVGETSLTRAVRGARVALGDSGARQSTLKTIRGHGYRFATPVRERCSALLSDDSDRRLTGALRTISDAARAALDAAAVIGYEFSTSLISAANDAGTAQIGSALEEAALAGLIRRAEVPGLYAFAGAGVRDTLCRELSAAGQRDLQRRVALALEEKGLPPRTAT